MLVMAQCAPNPSFTIPSLASSVLKPAQLTLHDVKTSLNKTDTSVPVIGALPFKAQCKSAVALVNERRIDFVRAKNVRTIGRLYGSANEKMKHKKKELTTAKSVERMLVWQHSKKIGPGFANLGNTCYLNSVLQCLTHTPCFAQLLLDREVFALSNGNALPSSSGHTKYKSGNDFGKNGFCGKLDASGFCSIRAMSRLLQSVHGNNAVRVLQPKEFVMNIRHISKRFRIGRQEDSHEFFRLLLDSMQRSCLRKAHIKSENHLVASTTFVHRIFGGKLKNSLKCAKCGYVSERFDDFLDLSLEISSGVNSVKGALRQFTTIEKLDVHNSWKCSSCGKFSCAEKGLTIAECPNVLVIQLKRFDLMFGKIKRHIEFSCSLDIASGMSKICEDRCQGRTKYELHAVLVHAGFSTDCGHYYAFVKGSSGQWYEMNDDSVRWVSIDTVLKQKAYMLFYSRVLPLSERLKLEGDEAHSKENNETKQSRVASKSMTKSVLATTKELDMNAILTSLKMVVANQLDAKTDDNFSDPAKVEKATVTFKVTTKLIVSSWALLAHHRTKGSILSNFGGHVGRLYRYGLALWKSCPRAIRVPFNPWHVKKVGVRNAALFGREVYTWADETDVEYSKTTSSSDTTLHETIDRELTAKRDRVLNTLKQEEWIRRNTGRQGCWDENLDKGKVKKVKKRKEFVANEGRKNIFQTTFTGKRKDVKRQRTTATPQL
ncbi:unnamed protein product [Peronospora belbahrii]|uniref:Ubiquitin carboxyl-terminal hydrolase n=1 Tax=Peronospora belbahrii TaxID=622444 RepID=A0ABN8D1V5_9STRA|nr:unnamed protein product [Peronospora belbahrii]